MKKIRQCNWNLSEYECCTSFYATSSVGASVAGIFAFGSSWLGSGLVGGLIVIFGIFSLLSSIFCFAVWKLRLGFLKKSYQLNIDCRRMNAKAPKTLRKRFIFPWRSSFWIHHKKHVLNEKNSKEIEKFSNRKASSKKCTIKTLISSRRRMEDIFASLAVQFHRLLLLITII